MGGGFPNLGELLLLGKRQDVVEVRTKLFVYGLDRLTNGMCSEHDLPDVGCAGTLFNEALNVLACFPLSGIQSLEGLSVGSLKGFDSDDLRFGQTQGLLESFQSAPLPLPHSLPSFQATLETAGPAAPAGSFLSRRRHRQSREHQRNQKAPVIHVVNLLVFEFSAEGPFAPGDIRPLWELDRKVWCGTC